MYDLSGKMNVILITIWWFQKSGKERQLSEEEARKFDVERFNLRKLCELEVMKQYQIKISNMFAALEGLNDSKYINRAWENIKESIKAPIKDSLVLHELK
jgi:hypothetical protein